MNKNKMYFLSFKLSKLMNFNEILVRKFQNMWGFFCFFFFIASDNISQNYHLANMLCFMKSINEIGLNGQNFISLLVRYFRLEIIFRWLTSEEIINLHLNLFFRFFIKDFRTGWRTVKCRWFSLVSHVLLQVNDFKRYQFFSENFR